MNKNFGENYMELWAKFTYFGLKLDRIYTCLIQNIPMHSNFHIIKKVQASEQIHQIGNALTHRLCICKLLHWWKNKLHVSYLLLQDKFFAWGPSIYPWILPAEAADETISCHHSHILPAPPLHFTPTTSTLLKADTQSSTFLHFKCPNHLNLPCITTSAIHWIIKRLYKTLIFFILQRLTFFSSS